MLSTDDTWLLIPIFGMDRTVKNTSHNMSFKDNDFQTITKHSRECIR